MKQQGPTVVLAGRRFSIGRVDRPVHIAYIGTVVIPCKAPVLEASAKIGRSGYAQRLSFARNLRDSLYNAGQLFPLLAGFLTEHGSAWSLEGAATNAQLFASVTEAAEKQQLTLAVLGVLEALRAQWSSIVPRLDAAQAHVRRDPSDPAGQRFIIVE